MAEVKPIRVEFDVRGWPKVIDWHYDRTDSHVYYPEAALQAVEADRDREQAKAVDWHLRCELAEKQVEEVTAQRDEFAKKGLAWMKLLHEGEKQLEELRAAIRDVRLSRTELLALATQPDTASEAPRCGGSGILPEPLTGDGWKDCHGCPDCKEAPRCEHVFRMSSYGRCIKCGIQGNPMGGREDR